MTAARGAGLRWPLARAAKPVGLVFAAVLPLLPLVAAAGSGWTAYASVVELKPSRHGRFVVTLRVDDNPSGCRDKTTFYQDYGFPGSARIFDTLLLAVERGNQVRVLVTGVCDINGYSEIAAVGIVP